VGSYAQTYIGRSFTDHQTPFKDSTNQSMLTPSAKKQELNNPMGSVRKEKEAEKAESY